ncbi:MAG: ABC transporter permease [Thermomicrobiales bacterium]|nr:ABC transporter permease [Thermomicrobiales bacterium]
MLAYIIRRILQSFIVLIGVSIAVAAMTQFVPGDPAKMILGDNASPEALEALREDLGLNDPFYVQYWRFVERLVTEGSLGKSIRTNREVLTEIGERFPNTLILTLGAVLVSSTIGIASGVLASVRRGKPTDIAVLVGTTIGLSVPSFWVALLMIWLFAVKLHWLPVTGSGSWKHAVMPIITLSLGAIATKSRLTRSSMLEVLGQDYIRTSRAKGLSERRVVIRHALRNALLPVITIIGLQFGGLLGGAFITETIFSWPGVGQLAVSSILFRDFPVVQGTVLLVTVAFVFSNLLVDIAYAWVDPRIRYS